MGTRRVGDNVWVRTTECVLPNVQQIAPIWNDGKGPEEGLDGPMMTRWIVPRDDASTMLLELRHISESGRAGTGPGGWTGSRCCPPSFLSPISSATNSCSPAGLRGAGQPAPHRRPRTGAPGRHRPGGVTMFRRQLRRGIRAVQSGEGPGVLGLDENAHVSTFCLDTQVQMPPAATPEEDTKQLRELGLRMAAEYINNPPHKS